MSWKPRQNDVSKKRTEFNCKYCEQVPSEKEKTNQQKQTPKVCGVCHPNSTDFWSWDDNGLYFQCGHILTNFLEQFRITEPNP